jgi:hypothetical protein
MSKTLMTGIVVGAVGAAVLWVTLTKWVWDPARQIRGHHAQLMAAVEKRSWAAVDRSFSENYRDRWDHDKAFLMGFSREVFRQFVVLELRSEEVALDLESDGREGRVFVKIRLTGHGGPYAEAAVAEVRRLEAPFEFRWSRRGLKPWDWKLVEFNQPELEIPDLPAI